MVKSDGFIEGTSTLWLAYKDEQGLDKYGLDASRPIQKQSFSIAGPENRLYKRSKERGDDTPLGEDKFDFTGFFGSTIDDLFDSVDSSVGGFFENVGSNLGGFFENVGSSIGGFSNPIPVELLGPVDVSVIDVPVEVTGSVIDVFDPVPVINDGVDNIGNIGPEVDVPVDPNVIDIHNTPPEVLNPPVSNTPVDTDTPPGNDNTPDGVFIPGAITIPPEVVTPEITTPVDAGPIPPEVVTPVITTPVDAGPIPPEVVTPEITTPVDAGPIPPSVINISEEPFVQDETVYEINSKPELTKRLTDLTQIDVFSNIPEGYHIDNERLTAGFNAALSMVTNPDKYLTGSQISDADYALDSLKLAQFQPGTGVDNSQLGNLVDSMKENISYEQPAITPDDILSIYQAPADIMVLYEPEIGPLPINIPFITGRRMTQTEADLLNDLGNHRGIAGLIAFKNISSNDINDPGHAYRAANEYFPRIDATDNPIPGGEDGHNDAFRHAFWNVLMTKHFGEDFATAFATAHEGRPDNVAGREAMDLFNNELGRRIATENPNASDKELADLTFTAINNGEAVVIDRNNNLAFSNQVAVGATGNPSNNPPR